jgi:hypothetical protein
MFGSRDESARSNVRLGMSEPYSLTRGAAERLYARVGRCYGPAVLRTLFPSIATAAAEESALTSQYMTVGEGEEGGSSPHPGEVERLVLAALLIMLHEGGGGCKISFMLPELFRLLGWPVTASSWDVVMRALDGYMQPVRREFSVVSPGGRRGREARVTSWRRLIAGYEYSEESEQGVPETVNLAGRQITVTFNPDVLPEPKEASSLP